MLNDKRIKIIVGHYGSGKTEFSVNYAIKLNELNKKIAIVDLDIVNPYFRSREKQELFLDQGIELISNSFGKDITAELPALAPQIFAPLQNKEKHVILDVGGDSVGAKTLMRYKKYFTENEYDLFLVANANRPETDNVDKLLWYKESIENEIGIKITGLINNTHMLQYTTVEDVLKGNELVSEVSEKTQIPVKYTCCIKNIEKDLPETIKGEIFIIDMVMREKWMMTD